MQIVPITDTASQTLRATLGGQACTINLYQKSTGLYCDVYVADMLVIGGVVCENSNRIVRDPYLGLVGDLLFLDTHGASDPGTPGLGSRFVLMYLTAADVAAAVAANLASMAVAQAVFPPMTIPQQPSSALFATGFSRSYGAVIVYADPYWNSVVMLLHGDGTNASTTFVDTSASAHAFAVSGGPSLSTTTPKFGTASMAFSAVGSATTGTSSDFNFSTGAFTVEFWMKTSVTTPQGIFATSTGSGGFGVRMSSGTNITWEQNGGLAGSLAANFVNYADGAWHHVAIANDGAGRLSIFFDGVLTNVQASVPSPTFDVSNFYLGQSFLGEGFVGDIDDFRMTKGIARYTASFTPPSAAFADGLFGGGAGLVVSAALSASGTSQAIGSALLGIAFTGYGVVVPSGAASLTIGVGLSGYGQVIATGSGAFGNSLALSASGIVLSSGSAAFGLSNALAGAGAVGAIGSATFATSTALAGRGSVVVTGSVTFGSSVALAGSGFVGSTGAAALVP